DVGAVIRRQAGVVFVSLPGGVRIHPQKARIYSSNRPAFVAHKLFEPALRTNAQVGLLDVLRRQRREARQVLDDLLILRRRQFVSLLERRGVFAMGELAGLLRHLGDAQVLQIWLQQMW